MRRQEVSQQRSYFSWKEENQDEEFKKKKKKKSHSLGNEAENREDSVVMSQVEESPGIHRLRILRIRYLEIRRPQNYNTLRAKATE